MSNKFRHQIATVLAVAAIILFVAVGVPAFLRGQAYSKAHALDNRTVTVAGTAWSLCGDIQVTTTAGEQVFFPGHTPFASYVFGNLWRDELVLPAGSELHLFVTTEPQITPSWLQSGIVANEWEPGTWIQVEIVDHF